MATDQEMLDRIAKLSTAIEQQKHIQAFGPRKTYASTPFRPTSYNSSRGRGGNMSTRPNYVSHHVRPAPYTTPYPRPAPYVRPAPYAAPYTAPYTAPYAAPYTRPPPYVRPHVPSPTTHNKTLVLNGAPRRNLIINHKGTKTNNTMVETTDAVTGRKQVSINGVDFVVKGKKLVRKDLFDSNTTKSNLMTTLTGPKVLVRRTIKRRDKNQNMVLGKTPARIMKPKKVTRRSKGGNMVFTRGPEGYVRQGIHGKSLILNTQAKKKPRYCGFFTRYGKCPNDGRCPFTHDINRRAICPRFLQNRCKKACKLSHTPNQYNMPHCVHFQKGLCKNDPCMYIHVRTNTDAPVCKAFAMEGYCSKGTDCVEKHIHVCPEFAETGKCSNANCRLPHVARRTAEKSSGIIRLGSWVSPQYFHAQKMAKLEKRKALEEATAAKVWTRPQELDESKEVDREKEEQDGFVRLFDDSDDDDGWSQFERESEGGDIKSLRFNEEESEEESSEEDEEEEEDEDEEDEEGSEEEVYEEVSDDGMSDIEEPPLPA